MAKTRLANSIFQAARGTKNFLFPNMSKLDIGFRLAPDVLGAAQTAYYTPGDVVDKTIATTADFVGSAGTGLLLSRPFGASQMASIVDMGGSVAGFHGGNYVGNQLQKGKDKLMGGEGLSANERANIEYENALTQQIIADLDAAGLITPAGRAMFTNDNTGMI